MKNYFCFDQWKFLRLSVLIFSFVLELTSPRAHAGESIQACLEVYQAKAGEVNQGIQRENQANESSPYTRYLKPSHFPRMHGPCHYFRAMDRDDGGGIAYGIASMFTLGAIPVAHWGIKGGYELLKYGVSGAVDAAVIAPINLGKKIYKSASHQDYKNPYRKEIELIQDLIRYDEDQILFSDRFKKVAYRPGVRARYPSHRDVYRILKLAFEKQLPCMPNIDPDRYKKIVEILEVGELELIVKYDRNDRMTENLR